MSTNEHPSAATEPESTYVEAEKSLGDEEQIISEEVNSQESNQNIDDNYLAEMETLRKLSDENHQRYLRAQADFENFRRRTRTEKEEFLKYASLKIVEPLLSILDNFERALNTSKESKDFDALWKGLDMTHRQLNQILEQEGVKAIDSVGKPFNPEFHEAIMQVQSDEFEEGIIVEEIARGYMMKDKVIRPAMVRVSM